jgi:hypothetical protein
MHKDGKENKKMKFKINKMIFIDLIIKDRWLRNT